MAGRKGQFQPGQSGNPAGKPRGAKDRRTAMRKLLEPHSEALVQKAVALALEGDTTALRLCLERIIPALRPQDMPINLGSLKGSLSEQARQINAAMAAGKLPPAEATAILNALAGQAKIEEFTELERRIAVLEAGSHDTRNT